jgi:hypothetical protein
MKTSESISKLTAALVAAQADIKTVAKDRQNPHFKSSYATLDAIIEEVRPVLAKHGLAVVQGASSPHSTDDGRLSGFSVETMLVHSSGEFITGGAVMPLAKSDPQGAGSAMTYGRRYGVSALLFLATDEDDDGHSAGQGRELAARPAAPRPAAPAQRPAAPRPAPMGEVLAAAVEHLDLEQEPNCPKCAGAMWDNRVGKKNPKAPDWKCKDKQCDGVVWPPRDGGAAPARKAAPAVKRDASYEKSMEQFPEVLEQEEDELPF